MSDILDTRSEQRSDGLINVFERVADPDAEPEKPNPSDYAGLTEAERVEYLAQDAARVAAWKRYEWQYVGVRVRIVAPPPAGRVRGAWLADSSVWAVESDSDPEHFAELEADCLAEAESELETLRAILASRQPQAPSLPPPAPDRKPREQRAAVHFASDSAAEELIHAGRAVCMPNGAGTLQVTGDWEFVSCLNCRKVLDRENRKEAAEESAALEGGNRG